MKKQREKVKVKMSNTKICKKSTERILEMPDIPVQEETFRIKKMVLLSRFHQPVARERCPE